MISGLLKYALEGDILSALFLGGLAFMALNVLILFCDCLAETIRSYKGGNNNE